MKDTTQTPHDILAFLNALHSTRGRLGECTPLGLAAYLGIAVQTALSFLDALTESGHVSRDADPLHGYVYTLTRKGLSS